MQSNYRDLAILEDGAEADVQLPGKSKLSCTFSSSNRTFPVKFHDMLIELEKEGLVHIASWQPHGRCFLIHNRKELAEIILPK